MGGWVGGVAMSVRVHVQVFWLHEGVAVFFVSFLVFSSVVAFVG